MSGISFSSSRGSFDKTIQWMKELSNPGVFQQLSKYGQMGVTALANATPKDSGLTAESWYYEIVQDRTSWSIIWGNRNVEDGRPIAILLQYGHATGDGTWVEGQDYINPALKPILEQMANAGWKVVTGK